MIFFGLDSDFSNSMKIIKANYIWIKIHLLKFKSYHYCELQKEMHYKR